MFASRTNWPLAPNRFSVALDKHRAAGRELLDLTASNPAAIGLHFDAPAILSSLADPRALEYHPDAKGLPIARDAVAAYYRELGVSIAPDRLLLTTSTSEAYSFIFRLLCDPDDEILVPAPSYPLFQFLADIQDVRLQTYPLFYDHGWHLDMHAVTTAAGDRTRAILLVHPNNPTGSYVKPNEAKQLHALCSQRGMALVVDEVFLDFAHDGGSGFSFASQPATANPPLTFTLSGLSKIAGLPQMKVAWIAVTGPGDLARDAMARLEIIADTYLSMNAPIQLAAPFLFAQRGGFQRQLMARIRDNMNELDRQLSAQKTCARLQVEGGWYATLRVPVTRSDEDLAIHLLEQQSVLVHPGHFYDFPADGYLVISLIAPEAAFKEGVKRLLKSVMGNL
ncbi:MAG TPA: pyridoxal phosphate-dependent aminotransferase [Terriglobales bacterium]|nr:pyridoxal phosphate-dependent aminotransferase [Terriglobales bacterium]